MSSNDNDTQQTDDLEQQHAVDAADAENAATEDNSGNDNSTDDNSNHEAAKYRRRLRDTETERDQLATRLDTLQRAEAERIASETLHKGAGLWANGTELADLLDDDGDVSAEKVKQAAHAAVDSLGLQTRRNGPYSPREGANPRQPRRSSSDAMVDVVMGRTG